MCGTVVCHFRLALRARCSVTICKKYIYLLMYYVCIFLLKYKFYFHLHEWCLSLSLRITAKKIKHMQILAQSLTILFWTVFPMTVLSSNSHQHVQRRYSDYTSNDNWWDLHFNLMHLPQIFEGFCKGFVNPVDLTWRIVTFCNEVSVTHF